ncbi:MAG: metal ABC transporter substrate-binding protein [Candidatus Thorarchaeota archaeon]
MRKWGLIALGFMLLSSSAFCFTPKVTAQTELVLDVAVSVVPLAGIVEKVGQGYIGISVLLPEGVEPHSIQLPQSAIDAATTADLLVLTGHFPWEEDLANQTGTPFISLEDYEAFGAVLSPIPGSDNDIALAQDHGNENPHSFWLLPKNAIAIANTTRDALTSLHSDLEDYWETMFEGFVQEVEAFQELVVDFDSDYHFSDLRAVVVFPAEAYVAETFGIEVETVLQEGDNIFISGAQLIEVQTALVNGSLDIILGSDIARLQAGGEFARQLEQDTNSKLIWFRAIFFSGLSDYLSIMTYNLGALTSGLEASSTNNMDNSLNFVLLGVSGFLAVVVIVESVLLVQRIREDD